MTDRDPIELIAEARNAWWDESGICGPLADHLERALAHKNILAERLGAAHAEIQALYRVVTAARAWRANGPCDECLEDLDAALAALGGNQMNNLENFERFATPSQKTGRRLRRISCRLGIHGPCTVHPFVLTQVVHCLTCDKTWAEERTAL